MGLEKIEILLATVKGTAVLAAQTGDKELYSEAKRVLVELLQLIKIGQQYEDSADLKESKPSREYLDKYKED